MNEIKITSEIDLSRSSRRGKFRTNKIPTEALRSYCVSVRLNVEELQILEIKRGSYKKGEWLRMASLQKMPPIIPTINLKAWKALSEISQKLNRIATHIDSKSKESQLTHTELFVVKRLLEELRYNLIQVDFGSNSCEGYAEDQER